MGEVHTDKYTNELKALISQLNNNNINAVSNKKTKRKSSPNKKIDEPLQNELNEDDLILGSDDEQLADQRATKKAMELLDEKNLS